MRRRAITGVVLRLTLLSLLAALALPCAAHALTAAQGEAQLREIEARANALAKSPQPDRKALAELDRRAHALAEEASRALAALREDAAERDADMRAVVESREWQALEALLLKLRFRIAALQLERARAGDPDKERLARAAADGFGAFAEAADPTVAAEGRYGRGLARIVAGDRAGGIADLRAAAQVASVAPRARLALAEALAEGGNRKEALDVVSKQLAGGNLPADLALRAELLRLQLAVATRKAGQTPPSGISAQVEHLLNAGEPWRSAALATLEGNEDLLPTGPDADALALRLRADAAARAGDAAQALDLYRRAVERDPKDRMALEGLARSALAMSEWQTVRDAVARLDALDTGEDGAPRPRSRDMALVDLRAAYGAWQQSGDAQAASEVARAADALERAQGVEPDDRAEAAFRRAEVARAQGDLDAAIAGFTAIDAPAWRAAAGTAALQARVLRHARAPEREPRAALLADLEAWLAREDLPDDARATAIVLDATVRTMPATEAGTDRTGAAIAAGSGAASASGSARSEAASAAADVDGASAGALDDASQRAALARLREFPRRFPDAQAMLPAVLRARALLEVALGEAPDTAMLDVLPADARPATAAAIAGDLRDDLGARAPRASASDAERQRARLALEAALAFAALAPEGERTAGRLDLAESALALGDAQTALALFRAESEARPNSLRALRGVALASRASGDEAGARAAWERLAALPDLPPALREEAERERAASVGAP
ncbi:MAG TPA: hypothetical protein VIS07_08415 [Candidatus Binatia bacterium]